MTMEFFIGVFIGVRLVSRRTLVDTRRDRHDPVASNTPLLRKTCLFFVNVLCVLARMQFSHDGAFARRVSHQGRVDVVIASPAVRAVPSALGGAAHVAKGVPVLARRVADPPPHAVLARVLALVQAADGGRATSIRMWEVGWLVVVVDYVCAIVSVTVSAPKLGSCRAGSSLTRQ